MLCTQSVSASFVAMLPSCLIFVGLVDWKLDAGTSKWTATLTALMITGISLGSDALVSEASKSERRCSVVGMSGTNGCWVG